MTSNLPPNLNEGFNDGPEMRVCPECMGSGIYDFYTTRDECYEDECDHCEGTGQVPITASDKEDEQEKKSGLYYQ